MYKSQIYEKSHKSHQDFPKSQTQIDLEEVLNPDPCEPDPDPWTMSLRPITPLTLVVQVRVVGQARRLRVLTVRSLASLSSRLTG